jgi:predicted XRE-type DNA-binding protein
MQVRSFPAQVRRSIGSALYDAQKGEKAPAAKPFKGVGSGVFEIALRWNRDVQAGCRSDKATLQASREDGGTGMTLKKDPEYEIGSGNVFANLGLDDADELLTRAQLGHAVRLILKAKKLKQREIAALLGIDQAEVSKLMNGQYHLFAEKRLFTFLKALEQKVTIHVSRRRKGDPYQEVTLATDAVRSPQRT